MFLGTLAIVGLGCILMPRYYRASAYVMPSEAALTRPLISGATSALDPGGGLRDTDPRRKSEAFATIIALGTTSDVRRMAIASLGLKMTDAQLEPLVTVEPAAGTVIRITCLSRTSDGAIDLANAMMGQFKLYYQTIMREQARNDEKLLSAELTKAETQYEEARDALEDFKEREGAKALPMGAAENPFLTQYYALGAERDATRARLLEVEGRLRALRAELVALPPTRESATSTTDNPVANELQGELAKLERDLLLAQTRYTEKHRRIKDLKAQIADLKERLSREGDRMITHRTVEPNPVYRRIEEDIVNLQPERSALTSRLSSLETAIKEKEDGAEALGLSSVRLLSLTRAYDEADARRSELKAMLERAGVEVQLASSADEIREVSRASSAVGPVAKIGPSRTQLMLLGLVLSLCLGLGIAAALAFLDDRVQVREDLERELQLPVPGVIPALPGGDGGVPVARVTELQPLSPVAEAYRFLKTELVYSSDGRHPQTILIATARPGQGGSTTAVNLAIALAEGGSRVLLVDADMRRPTLHRLFEQTNDAGLTSLLANGGAVAADALRKTGLENLLLLPAGPMVDNPAALLTSERMRRLLQRMREHADYIVIDTPSAATFADATLLASLVDAVVLVTRANQPIRAVDRRTKELFTKVGANVIGAVLNEANPSRVDSSYFYGHYYSVPRELPSRTSRASATAEAIGGAGSASLPSAQERAPQLPAAAGQGREAAVAGRPSHGEAEVWTQTARAARRPARRGRRAVVAAAIAVAAIAAAIAALSHFGLLKGSAPGVPAVAPAANSSAVTVDAFARRRMDVRVEQDGKLLHAGELAVGPQRWQGSEEVTVWVSDPAFLDLTVNGKEIGTLGKAGDPPKLRRFTAEDGVQQ